MFDTHCHLNFKAYRKTLEEVIAQAKTEGVDLIVMPGTDVPTTQRAIEISDSHDGLYVAAGIHPHHVFELYTKQSSDMSSTDDIIQHEIGEIEKLLSHPRVVAVGEIGIDRHMYIQTKYEEYKVTEEFVTFQKTIMKEQIKLALKHNKSVIIHNREAPADLLEVMNAVWDDRLSGRAVFHCCEANDELLAYAKDHGLFVGIDGDITYGDTKKEFIKKVPLEMLVLETDGPYLLPEPLRAQKMYPNKPGNLRIIAEAVADAKSVSVKEVIDQTMQNGKKLFQIS